MTDKIFSSMFKLNFFRKEIEIDYQQQKDNKIYSYNEYVILFSFAFSIAVTILNSLFIQFSIFSIFRIILYFTYAVQVIYLVFVSISFFSKNIKVLKWIHLINYYLLYFNFINFRFTIVRLIQSDCIFYYFLLLAEVMVRLVWNTIGLQSFLECFILNFIWLISMWIIYPLIYLKETYYYNSMLNYLAYSLTIVFIISFSYVLDRQRKYAFYLHWNLGKKAAWLTNVLETMNAGFLSIKGHNFVYINSYLMNQIKKIKRSDKSQEVWGNKNCNENEVDVKNLIAEFKAEFYKTSKENYVKTFTKYISQIPDINTFKLIGDKVFELEDSELSFEIQCRYSKSETEGDELDFLLNDVTRTKLREKENAEFKYKTVFLSKVAHEFKNPLICISEMIDQINDDIKTKSIKDNSQLFDKHLLNTFEQIKSLSNFLLILVKDLNYFSESQIGENKTSIEKQETNLEEVINFCRMITESLIQKNNKYKALKFLTVIKDNVPNIIMTDHWKLKQILINLLSNSVKFTLYGQIVLEVSLEKINGNEKIKFLVKDTGVGIKEEQQKKLFIPFSKGFGNYNNEMGSGLGLSIANEIAKNLGSENIKFHSEYERGSSFWFYVDNLPLEEKIIEIKLRDKTLKNDNEVSKDDEEAIIEKDIISNSSNTTKQNEFDPDQIKSNCRFIIRERTNNMNNSSSSSSSQKSPSINFKYETTEIKNPSSDSLKDGGDNKLSVFDLISNDLNKLRKRRNFFNIMVVDDDEMTRQSTIRVLNNISKELNVKINIIEAEDGIECIYLIYKTFTQGIKISLIFSDENMHFMNGSRSSEIICDILHKKNINEIPFYLVTAYDSNIIKSFVTHSIKMILAKPLSKDIAKKLILEKMNQ